MVYKGIEKKNNQNGKKEFIKTVKFSIVIKDHKMSKKHSSKGFCVSHNISIHWLRLFLFNYLSNREKGDNQIIKRECAAEARIGFVLHGSQDIASY